MSTFTCPDGHVSIADDYCDVCGAPIAPAGSGGEGSVAEPVAEPDELVCRSCGAGSPPGSLFCEDCGYDFTTGAMPEPMEDPSLVIDPSTAPSPLLVGEGARGAGPLPTEAIPSLGAVDPVAPAAAPAATGPAPTTHPDQDPTTHPDQDPGQGRVRSVAPSLPEVEWVVEVWVDPDWYAVQQSPDPCPSPGMPQVIPLTVSSVLVGRRSASRAVNPEIDCSADVGVSRRHAQLTTDGQRWWIEDLQSANGTYIGAAGGPVPTDPLPVARRRELNEDDRVYLGAWTRLVVRRVAPGELEAMGWTAFRGFIEPQEADRADPAASAPAASGAPGRSPDAWDEQRSAPAVDEPGAAL